MSEGDEGNSRVASVGEEPKQRKTAPQQHQHHQSSAVHAPIFIYLNCVATSITLPHSFTLSPRYLLSTTSTSEHCKSKHNFLIISGFRRPSSQPSLINTLPFALLPSRHKPVARLSVWIQHFLRNFLAGYGEITRIQKAQLVIFLSSSAFESLHNSYLNKR